VENFVFNFSNHLNFPPRFPLGIICVPAGGGGTFLGGYLVKKLKLSCSGTMKFCMIASMFAVLFTICFFLSCPNLKYAGVTSTYQLNVEHSISDGNFERYTSAASQSYNLDNQCNKQCGCTKENYEPVRIFPFPFFRALKSLDFLQICGNDGLTYYNPCYAGCKQEKSHDGSKVYLDCNCIISNLVVNHSSSINQYNAVNKMCDSKCDYLPIFIILCFFVMFFTFLATMPALSATLR
jgi:organic anion transporter 4A